MADMKGFIAAVLDKVPTLASADLQTPVHIALSYDEEVGCRGVGRMIARLGDVVPMPAKLEPGNPAMVVIMMLDRALDVLLEIGIERIEAHARDLSELLTAALQKAGRVVITPNRREARSGNTVYLSEDANGEEERLAAAGVLVWGDYGRVRVSGHLYNGSDDVDRFISILTEQER